MNTKFTPGPWSQSHREVESGGYSTQVYDQKGEAICTVDWYVIPTEKGFTTNRDSNAHLIACAPDMYEMLESKLNLIRCGIGANYSGDPKENPKYLEVVELLKRARGE